jgi:hypothetical protein
MNTDKKQSETTASYLCPSVPHLWLIFSSLFLAPAIANAAIPTTAPAVVDATSLTGKVLCGYQGWFNTPTDGADRGWVHWGRGAMKPGYATVDLWPDTSELTAAEKFQTGFKLADGSHAVVFSSYNHDTVERHFKWMRDYGIDGVFLQRFATGLGNPVVMNHYDGVARNVFDGARKYGRTFAIMYDLSGMHDEQLGRVIDDWKHLIDVLHIPQDPRYLHDDHRPVVALWGIGFSDGRDPLLSGGAMRLIRFLKGDPAYGNSCVVLGLPSGWRTLDRDAVHDARLTEIIQAADVVCPWTVGRYTTPEQAGKFATNNWVPDLAWCAAHGKTYMPVVFPGFSWHNLKKGKAPTGQIPRLGGRFLWSQYVAARDAGATVVYQAMFDEVDEGTAIFKCTNDVPVPDGENQFLTFDGLPSDFYLRLVGEGSKLIRREISPAGERLITPGR